MGNGFEVIYSAKPREAWFRDWYLTGLYLYITREKMRQPCSAWKFVSQQNPTILEKRGILAVSRELSSKIDENVSAWQINCNLDSLFSLLPKHVRLFPRQDVT